MKVKAVKLGEEFEYNNVKYQTVHLTLEDDIEYVWAKTPDWDLPKVGDKIKYVDTKEKSKAGLPKIKSVVILNQQPKSFVQRENEKMDMERMKQIYISRSVALDKAIQFFNITKGATKNAAWAKDDYLENVITIAYEFEKYLLDGTVPSYSNQEGSKSPGHSDIGKKVLRLDNDGGQSRANAEVEKVDEAENGGEGVKGTRKRTTKGDGAQ
jgi:hypothetical protein